MYYPKYKYILAVSDLVLVLLCYYVAFQIRFPDSTNIFRFTTIEYIFAGMIIMVLAIAHLFVFQSLNLYKINIILRVFPQVFLILKGLIYATLIVILVQFVAKYSFVFESRLLYFYSLSLAASSMILFRIVIFRTLFTYFGKKGVYSWKVAIIGTGENAKMIAADLLTKPIYGTTIVGFIGNNFQDDEVIFQGYKLLGSIENLEASVKEHSIDEIIIAPDNINYEELIGLIERSQRTEIAIQVVSDLYRIIPEKLVVEKYSNIPLVRMHGRSHTKTWTVPRRIFDLLFSTILLLLISPILVIISILIMLTSEGSVIYKQRRIGKDGKEFTFYKFRTMRVGSDKDDSRSEAMKNFIKGSGNIGENSKKVVDESNFTSIGKFLRKTSLDEVMQFFNVLKGDMAVVGPRPCLPYEYKHYDDWQKKRNEVLPGITGLWQVSGRSEVAHNEMIVMDLYYIRNASPWFDLQLIIKTIIIVLSGKGGG
ncbi:MAG: sugar transferase [Candidatus Marinimicrobia bacterium]|nr:sugar transferase [Candidatus Neomarinimicrobiota bacterium]